MTFFTRIIFLLSLPLTIGLAGAQDFPAPFNHGASCNHMSIC